jgi:hypothetical protein
MIFYIEYKHNGDYSTIFDIEIYQSYINGMWTPCCNVKPILKNLLPLSNSFIVGYTIDHNKNFIHDCQIISELRNDMYDAYCKSPVYPVKYTSSQEGVKEFLKEWHKTVEEKIKDFCLKYNLRYHIN